MSSSSALARTHAAQHRTVQLLRISVEESQQPRELRVPTRARPETGNSVLRPLHTVATRPCSQRSRVVKHTKTRAGPVPELRSSSDSSTLGLHVTAPWAMHLPHCHRRSGVAVPLHTSLYHVEEVFGLEGPLQRSQCRCVRVGVKVKITRSGVTPNRFRSYPQREHVLVGQINVRVSLADWDGLLGRFIRHSQELEERRLGPEVVRQVFDCRLFQHLIAIHDYASRRQGRSPLPRLMLLAQGG